MLIRREWATPVVMGAFTLSGLTGMALLFGALLFGWKSQTTFTLHQWSGLSFALGGLAHITVNFPAYKRHLTQRLGLAIVSVYVVLALAAFLPLAPTRPANSPVSALMGALQQAPLNDMTELFGADPQTLAERLRAAGFQVESGAQSVAEVAGPDFERRMSALAALAGDDLPSLPPPPGPGGRPPN